MRFTRIQPAGAGHDKALAGIWRLFRRPWAFRQIKEPGLQWSRYSVQVRERADQYRGYVRKHFRAILRPTNLAEFTSSAAGRGANDRDLSHCLTAPIPEPNAAS
jgi:hypothetical protein